MLKETRKKQLIQLITLLQINIRDFDLLNIALTHSSYKKGSAYASNNERLEFFGDAVLKLYVSEYLMQMYSNYSEGQLSKLRAYVVSEKVLVSIADKLNLTKYLMVGKNEFKSLPPSILADSLEALIAVIYYDAGPIFARDFILKHWKNQIGQASKINDIENFKAILQEYLQGCKLGLPVYKTISETGPDHNKVFDVAVYLKDEKLAGGRGKTKKEASQDAAKNALIVLKHKL
ncbi:MAG: ribonuclease III [Candidatus Melainabacteria bacterium]|nr:ribonuclease III [Candidatus Melainabacteria bacterium]